MTYPFASDPQAWATCVLSTVLVAAWLWAVRRTDLAARGDGGVGRKAYFALAAAYTGLWLVYTSQLALRGKLLDPGALPPPFLRIMGPGLLLAFLAAFSPLGRRLAKHLGYPILIGFQAFRIPVEILLDSLYRHGRIPVQMTWEGRNFDIISGVTAVIVTMLAARGKANTKLILGWNLLGAALLLNIMITAILSLPGPLRVFTNEPPNELVLHFPFVWIPAVFVLAALLGHLLVFRKLRMKEG